MSKKFLPLLGILFSLTSLQAQTNIERMGIKGRNHFISNSLMDSSFYNQKDREEIRSLQFSDTKLDLQRLGYALRAAQVLPRIASISIWGAYEAFPQGNYQFDSLSQFTIINSQCKQLPSWISDSKMLKSIMVVNHNEPKLDLDHFFKQFAPNGITHLELGFSGDVVIPESIGEWKSLEGFFLYKEARSLVLPESFFALENLHFIDIPQSRVSKKDIYEFCAKLKSRDVTVYYGRRQARVEEDGTIKVYRRKRY